MPYGTQAESNVAHRFRNQKSRASLDKKRILAYSGFQSVFSLLPARQYSSGAFLFGLEALQS
jgi:hypothetical protein